VDVFDTTLRDGAQFEGISLSVDDKLRIAEQLDHLGVRWIEGGYPQANPKDAEFFKRAPDQLDLKTSELVAFGSTRKPAGKSDSDPTLKALVEAGTTTACIVGKSWDFHVTEALGTTLDEGVAMVQDSVKFLRAAGLRVFFDAEHCFDGYKANSEFVLRVLVGIHTQNDTGCAVANSIAAVVGGATHLQGTVNGYGERTGNANLMTCIPNLELKMGISCLPEGNISRLTAVSRHVSELVNLPPHSADPYVGASAFAHKGGLHTSGLGKAGNKTYEHVDPGAIGNHTRVLVSDLGGRAGMQMKAEEFGITLDAQASGQVAQTVNDLEARGYVFEAADASLELLMRRATGWDPDDFRVESYRVSSYHREGDVAPGSGIELTNEATVKLWIGDDRRIAVGEGNGPVNALDSALRTALNGHFPALNDIHLVDYRVRVLDTAIGTEAVTRVLIESSNGDDSWFTVGVSENVIEASWMALTDGIRYGLLKLANTV
ncbi:MAG: citramalate synthase, partial [Acidimicrobiales bacterium]|nr:citramalate synthase [Acidimicrobiales bacterium]